MANDGGSNHQQKEHLLRAVSDGSSGSQQHSNAMFGGARQRKDPESAGQ